MSTEAPTPSGTNTDKSHGLPTWTIAVIVLGVLALIGIIITLVYFLRRKKPSGGNLRQNGSPQYPLSPIKNSLAFNNQATQSLNMDGSGQITNGMQRQPSFGGRGGMPVQGQGGMQRQPSFGGRGGMPVQGQGGMQRQPSFGGRGGMPVQGQGGMQRQPSFGGRGGMPVQGQGGMQRRPSFGGRGGMPVQGQ
ncbi:hypothetical protein TcCL_NonESM07744, partial [Trypanosoma cruzi]